MDPQEQLQELLDFFKALADARRLKILGLLAQESLTVEQLAAMLDLRPSAVAHHLSRLSQIGLVSAHAEGDYHNYSLQTGVLEAMAQRLLAQETLPAVAAEVDLDAYDRKVVRDFSDADGRLKAIPSQWKKLRAVLRYAVQEFEPGRRYSERQVNKRLEHFHPDTARLRRELVENRLMDREGGGGEYWRIEAEEG